MRYYIRFFGEIIAGQGSLKLLPKVEDIVRSAGFRVQFYLILFGAYPL